MNSNDTKRERETFVLLLACSPFRLCVASSLLLFSSSIFEVLFRVSLVNPK